MDTRSTESARFAVCRPGTTVYSFARMYLYSILNILIAVNRLMVYSKFINCSTGNYMIQYIYFSLISPTILQCLSPPGISFIDSYILADWTTVIHSSAAFLVRTFTGYNVSKFLGLVCYTHYQVFTHALDSLHWLRTKYRSIFKTNSAAMDRGRFCGNWCICCLSILIFSQSDMSDAPFTPSPHWP